MAADWPQGNLLSLLKRRTTQTSLKIVIKVKRMTKARAVVLERLLASHGLPNTICNRGSPILSNVHAVNACQKLGHDRQPSHGLLAVSPRMTISGQASAPSSASVPHFAGGNSPLRVGFPGRSPLNLAPKNSYHLPEPDSYDVNSSLNPGK